VNTNDKLLLQRLVVGHFIEKIPEDCLKSVIYVMQGDGIYERRKNRLGIFTTRITEIDIPGLGSDLKDGWELAVPRVPVSLLGTAVAFFRKVYAMHHSEAFVQFFYDADTKEYLLHCPKQTVSGASVKFERDVEFETPSRILVMEIHSHGNMGAFFSGTDDKDEKDDRFYGVVGKVSDFFPQMKLRLSMGGYIREVNINDIFDIDEEMYHAETFPSDWPNRIEKRKKEDKRGKKRERDLVIYPGHDRQAELFGGDALGTPYGMGNGNASDLYNKHFDGDHLYSPNDVVKEDDFYVQKDGKFWHIAHSNGDEVWTEVGKEEISQWLHNKSAKENQDPWAAECALEGDELEQYNERCEEWLRQIEAEENIVDRFPEANYMSGFPNDWRNSKF